MKPKGRQGRSRHCEPEGGGGGTRSSPAVKKNDDRDDSGLRASPFDSDEKSAGVEEQLGFTEAVRHGTQK